MRAGEERNRAAKINRKAALDAAKDHTVNAAGFTEFRFQLIPSGFATGAIAAEHRFAIAVFNAVDIDFNFVANFKIGFLAGRGEFAQCHAAFGFKAHINDSHVIFDGSDGAFYNAAFKAFVFAAK